MKPSNPSRDDLSSHNKTSGSALPWLILFIAAIACGVVLWRMRSVPTAPQPTEVPQPTKSQPSEIQSLIDNLVPIPKRNFLIGKTEVTQGQWEAVMGADANRPANPDHPVSGVSWNDCQIFLQKINVLPAVKDSGLSFRLPTEEEWVFACSAGASERFSKCADGKDVSENSLGRVAWYNANSDGKVHPVGQKEPNAFGLYDMHGNVSEWCQNEIGEVEAWAKGEGCEHNRVYHGGNANLHSRFCETSYRDWASPETRGDFLGFRLCAEKR